MRPRAAPCNMLGMADSRDIFATFPPIPTGVAPTVILWDSGPDPTGKVGLNGLRPTEESLFVQRVMGTLQTDKAWTLALQRRVSDGSWQTVNGVGQSVGVGEVADFNFSVASGARTRIAAIFAVTPTLWNTSGTLRLSPQANDAQAWNLDVLSVPDTSAGTAGANVGANKCVAQNVGLAYILADSTDDTKEVVGFSIAGALNGNPINFVTRGPVAGVLSGAKQGQPYFLGAAGALTATKPTTSGNVQMVVGYALNATDLYVLIRNWGVVP